MNYVKKFFGFMVFGIFLTGGSLSAQAMEAEEFTAEDWIEADGTYHFPITAEDTEWNSLGTAENMRKAAQIPDEILETISTDDLIQLVLEYPLLCDMKAFGSIQEGYEHVKEQFYAIPALLAREDCYEKLVDAYDNFEIPAERILDYSRLLSEDHYVEDFNALLQNENYRVPICEDAAVHNGLNILEMLLLDCIDSAVQNPMDTSVFAESYANKLTEKTASAYFENYSATYVISLLEEEENPLVYEIESVLQTLDIPTITTPSGTVVTDFTYNTNLYSYDASEYADALLKYNATLISTASRTFNCHSYAWLSSRYRDIYQYVWLNSISAFANDSYYTKSSAPGTGYIAVVGLHSGFVTQLNQYNPEARKPDSVMVSKWGDGPIVRHFLTSCPYYNSSQAVDYYYHE